MSMEPLPHLYTAAASASAGSEVWLETPGAAQLKTASPKEFGGPGGDWTPEALLVGAVADCFVLTFQALASASRLRWLHIACSATGTLDRVEGGFEFVWLHLHARVTIVDAADEARTRRLTEKADHACLVARSLKTPVQLEVEIVANQTTSVKPTLEPATS